MELCIDCYEMTSSRVRANAFCWDMVDLSNLKVFLANSFGDLPCIGSVSILTSFVTKTGESKRLKNVRTVVAGNTTSIYCDDITWTPKKKYLTARHAIFHDGDKILCTWDFGMSHTASPGRFFTLNINKKGLVVYTSTKASLKLS